VRIVAATNVNIRNAISEGRFREDLYYRLNSIPVQMPPLRERGEDVVLLFRLFAMQMAEKYKMDRVVLTDEAKQLLMRYKWPGNVRQLKNITEQISVLSKERVITPEILAKFIPQDRESTQLATIPREGGSDHSFENEREILYKILFELRGNVNDMRREMSALKKQLDDVQAGGSINTATNIPAPLSPIAPVSSLEHPTLEDAEAEEYVEPEKEPESLNLSDIGRQMLEKALERNRGNRKKAAQELGISDRTLYRRLKQFGLALFASLLLISCSVSYKFNGASIDYDKTKSIQIAEFPIRSSYVWAPMASMFNNQLKDQYANHTKLSLVRRNGDLKLEGEITRYEQRNKSVSSDGYSSQTELSMTVNVRFTNNKNHNEDFEQQFSDTQSYDSRQSLSAVQDELVGVMVKNIVEQIFNATVANW
jgi:AraC-like DNA-binding protein